MKTPHVKNEYRSEINEIVIERVSSFVFSKIFEVESNCKEWNFTLNRLTIKPLFFNIDSIVTLCHFLELDFTQKISKSKFLFLELICVSLISQIYVQFHLFNSNLQCTISC